LLASALRALFSRESTESTSVTSRHATQARTEQSKTPIENTDMLISGRPWERTILLPAIDPVEVSPAPVYEPAPLPPVDLPPPEPPSAPVLPVTYLGKLKSENKMVLYVRYQEQALSVRLGEVLGDEYRLEQVAADHAVFRYLPLDTLQELRWNGQ
jgi:hypothetical protein